jgi:polysaccharide deacetylase family protein (PEP-CTERM system associated)
MSHASPTTPAHPAHAERHHAGVGSAAASPVHAPAGVQLRVPSDVQVDGLAQRGGETTGADASSAAKRHILTVSLEDYYHSRTFKRLVKRDRWSRFESRLEVSTVRTLDLLDEFGVHATFFVLGWVADTVPELVRQVAGRGHEIASRGYYNRHIEQLSPEEFQDDLARSREALERAGGRRVTGFRTAAGWLGPDDLWALDALAASGYAYDSSIGPSLGSRTATPWPRFAYEHRAGRDGERAIWEFPISTAGCFGMRVPIAGGNYFRQLPHAVVSRAVARWDRSCDAPFVMYFHTWELDPEQPQISAAPLHARLRHYRNIDRMPAMLRHYLGRYRFSGIAEYLGIDAAAAPAAASMPALVPRERPAVHLGEAAARVPAGRTPTDARVRVRTAASVVIPCHNEATSLRYLANTLRGVEATLAAEYDTHFIFVDDGSTDDTWRALHDVFGGRPNATLVRHERNQGVAAAILTGVRAARTEVVCSMDCDCSYDPHELARMIPLLADGVDMVTASPYHPQGHVHNVPVWRLSLSKSLSAMYRVLLRTSLHTYTSCFRVYRRSAVLRVSVERGGFLGIAELLGRVLLAGGRVTEYPATLEVRIFGRSKMKLARTIVGHLGLLARLTALRLAARGGGIAATAMGIVAERWGAL